MVDQSSVPEWIKEFLRNRIAPAEILGEVGCYPYKEKDGQMHLFKVEYRALVAVAPQGPLVLMGWVCQ